MGCLNDYIGIRWCGGSASAPSSLYINDLPGLSIKQFNSITDEENSTFLSVWNNIQSRAEKRFTLDVREAMGAKYRLKSLAQGVNLGKIPLYDDYLNNLVTVPQGSSNFLHIDLVNNYDTEYTPSPLLQVHIQTISFYNPAGELSVGDLMELNIYDSNALGSDPLYTNSTYAIYQEGWNDFEVNQTFPATSTSQQPIQLHLSFGAIGFDVDTMKVKLNNNIQNLSCCGVKVYANLEEESLTYSAGITATFNVTCSWEGLICQNKNLFSRAFWYLCGIEFLTELIYSTTLSKWTTIGMNQMKDLRAEYEVEYQKSLKQVADGMYLDCDCCLDCASPVQIRTASQFF